MSKLHIVASKKFNTVILKENNNPIDIVTTNLLKRINGITDVLYSKMDNTIEVKLFFNRNWNTNLQKIFFCFPPDFKLNYIRITSITQTIILKGTY